MTEEDKKLNKMLNTSEFDNAMTGMEVMAEIVANYYRELIKNGVPKDVAKILICEFQAISLSQWKLQ